MPTAHFPGPPFLSVPVPIMAEGFRRYVLIDARWRRLWFGRVESTDAAPEVFHVRARKGDADKRPILISLESVVQA